ncbi:MAG: hypothetical protein M1831_005948 [Alyxoria varia]|nr:MAG: hypothetical protein M1831_005948 [Alyxoria varia]
MARPKELLRRSLKNATTSVGSTVEAGKPDRFPTPSVKSTADKSSTAKTFPFFRLPRELRDMIYEEAVVRCVKPYCTCKANFPVPTDGKLTYEPPLARASRQLKEECLPIFYRRNIFVFPIFNFHTCGLERWLENLGEERRKMIRRVALLLQGAPDLPKVTSHLESIESAFESSPGCIVKFYGNTDIMNIYGSAVETVNTLRECKIDYATIATIEDQNHRLFDAFQVANGEFVRARLNPLAPEFVKSVVNAVKEEDFKGTPDVAHGTIVSGIKRFAAGEFNWDAMVVNDSASY